MAALVLAREFPGLELVVISGRPQESFPIPVRFVEWSPTNEASALAAADIGVMPLDDDDWCRSRAVSNSSSTWPRACRPWLRRWA